MTIGIRAVLGPVSLHKSMDVEDENQELTEILVAHKDSQLEMLTKQKKSIEKLDSIQSSIDALSFELDEHFEVLRAYFGMVNETGPTTAFPDLKDKGLLGVSQPATLETEIKADLQHSVTKIGTDLEKKENKFIKEVTTIGTPAPDVSNLEKGAPEKRCKTEQLISSEIGKHWLEVSHLLLPNSLYSNTREIYKIKSIPSISENESSFEEDFGEGMIEKIGDNNSNSIGMVPTKADYSENMDLGVLNPLGNGSILVQRLLYSKCSNYNAKEPLDDGISKLIEYRTIAFEENEFMLKTENEVTIEAYILTALQCKGISGIVLRSSAVLITNNMRPTNYMKMQWILNLRNFFPMVFDPGGQQAGGIMPLQSLRTRILRGRECQEGAMSM